jgi:hypothetical protein
LTACEWLLGLACLQQTIELFQLRRVWADDGIWAWPVVRREFAGFPGPVRWLLDLALGAPGFRALLALRLVVSAYCLLPVVTGLPPHWAVPAILFASSLLIAVRWRGTFNGGSDYMTILIALSLTVARAFEGQEWIQRAALGYIAVQAVASYFVAGVVKARAPAWRDGRALGAFLRTPGYAVPVGLRRALAAPSRARLAALASWGIILFECTFPAVFLGRGIALGYLGAGLGFHLANVYVFGLNRFVLAWLAAYPAILFWTTRSAGG